MTVKDLIEVLQQCPDPAVPVVIRVELYDSEEGEVTLRCATEDVTFDERRRVVVMYCGGVPV